METTVDLPYNEVEYTYITTDYKQLDYLLLNGSGTSGYERIVLDSELSGFNKKIEINFMPLDQTQIVASTANTLFTLYRTSSHEITIEYAYRGAQLPDEPENVLIVNTESASADIGIDWDDVVDKKLKISLDLTTYTNKLVYAIYDENGNLLHSFTKDRSIDSWFDATPLCIGRGENASGATLTYPGMTCRLYKVGLHGSNDVGWSYYPVQRKSDGAYGLLRPAGNIFLPVINADTGNPAGTGVVKHNNYFAI